MGWICQNLKMYDDAIEQYKEALRMNPNDDETRYNLALCKHLQKMNENNKKDNDNNDKKNNDKDKQKDKEEKKDDKQKNDKPEKKENKNDKMSKDNAEQLA